MKNNQSIKLIVWKILNLSCLDNATVWNWNAVEFVLERR